MRRPSASPSMKMFFASATILNLFSQLSDEMWTVLYSDEFDDMVAPPQLVGDMMMRFVQYSCSHITAILKSFIVLKIAVIKLHFAVLLHLSGNFQSSHRLDEVSNAHKLRAVQEALSGHPWNHIS